MSTTSKQKNGKLEKNDFVRVRNICRKYWY